MGVDHLSKLPNKSAENNLGLSLIGIRFFPINSFSPHANPIPGGEAISEEIIATTACEGLKIERWGVFWEKLWAG
jgi:hypothetical protein